MVVILGTVTVTAMVAILGTVTVTVMDAILGTVTHTVMVAILGTVTVMVMAYSSDYHQGNGRIIPTPSSSPDRDFDGVCDHDLARQ
jgi:hypothetical protein